MIRLLWPWLFLLAPLPWLIHRYWRRAEQLQGQALHAPFLERLAALPKGRGGQVPTDWRRFLVAFLAWLLLLAAAAQPQWIREPESLPTSGRDIFLVLDVSGSMRTIDLAFAGTTTDRLTVVKKVAGDFIAKRSGDRLGLILFGSKAHVRAPLTHDHRSLGELLNEAEVAMAGEQTAIGEAIGLAVKRLLPRPQQSRAMILLTDGVSNVGSVGPIQAAQLAAEEGIRIHTIGIGMENTAGPTPHGPWSGQAARDFNREVLERVAELTGGSYAHALDTPGLVAAWAGIDKLEPSLGERAKDYFAKPLYPLPLFLALAIAAFLSLPGKRRP
jgi:Ca-activated chloride channel family protein